MYQIFIDACKRYTGFTSLLWSAISVGDACWSKAVGKNNANLNLGHQFYFWRDNKGLEIDLIIQTANQLIAIEIKSAQTFSSDFVKGLKKFNALSGQTGGVLIYDGEMEFTSQELIKVINWKSALINLHVI